MECPQVARRLPDYFAEAVEEPVRLAMESHRNRCPSCRDEWESLKTLWEGLAALSDEDAPPRMRSHFEAVLEVYEEGRGESAESAESRSGPGWRERLNGLNGWIAGWWPARPVNQLALALVLLIVGLVGGSQIDGRQQPSERLQTLEDEIRSLRQLVALSMLEQRSASQRLRGVTFSSRISRPDPEVLSSLLDTLNHDSSPNVRLAAVDVLRKFERDPLVRDGLIESLERQQPPMVQISLIDLLVELGEGRSIAVLERLSESETVHEEVRERAAWGIGQLG